MNRLGQENPHIFYNTPKIPWIGIHGLRKPLKLRRKETSQFS